jgi:hypothetical protein
VASCRLCGQTIRFDKDFKSDFSGKLIPLEEKSDERHDCPEWQSQHRRYYPCRDCSAPIYFDDKHITKNDKHIPLSKVTGEPHQCEEASPKA